MFETLENGVLATIVSVLRPGVWLSLYKFFIVQFQLSLLQLAGFLLPCYVMARSWYIIQYRRRRQVSWIWHFDNISLIIDMWQKQLIKIVYLGLTEERKTDAAILPNASSKAKALVYISFSLSCVKGTQESTKKEFNTQNPSTSSYPWSCSRTQKKKKM